MISPPPAVPRIAQCDDPACSCHGTPSNVVPVWLRIVCLAMFVAAVASVIWIAVTP